MYTWQKVIAFTAFSILCIFGYNDTEWRTYYITPLSNRLLIGCPFDQCYSLQDIFDNQSHFFASNTTLELLPGKYDITESVGQLLFTKIRNFRLQGPLQEKRSITIECLDGATLGFMFVRCENVRISNIQFSHCSAKLNLVANDTVLMSDVASTLMRHLEQNFSSCELENNTLCYSLLTSFSNANISLYRTAITYSKGIGVFGLDNKLFTISESYLAYNKVNCVNFVMDVYVKGTSFKLTDSHISFGRAKELNLAAGLNLFILADKDLHNINLTALTLKNNRAKLGDLYLLVSVDTVVNTDIDIDILITDLTSIQNETFVKPGIFIKFNIDLEYASSDCSLPSFYPEYSFLSSNCKPMCYTSSNYDNNIFDFPLSPYPRTCTSFSSDYTSKFECSLWDHAMLNIRSRDLFQRRINIVLQNSSFVGSCVIIRDSNVLKDSKKFIFEMNKINVYESKCRVALTIADTEVSENFKISDLTIMNSYNIFLISVSSHSLVLTGNISFVSNQGSAIVSRGKILFKGTINVSDNKPLKYESTLKISESCSVSFQGQISFINNSGRQGGAISADDSKLYFSGNASFIGNSANNGGAISLKEGSFITLGGNTNIVFRANTATMHGGAIYVKNTLFRLDKTKCFIQSEYNFHSLSVKFENNTAEIAGAALFGGWIDICKMSNDIKPQDFLDFKGENSVSSTPSRVCVCINSTVDKHSTETQIEIFPGQTFEIEVVAVGQRFGVVPAIVRAEGEFYKVDLHKLQELQRTEDHCTKLNFTVRSPRRSETLLLTVDRQGLTETIPNANFPEFRQFKVFIHFNPCPIGFLFDRKQNTCLCQEYLQSHGVQCNFLSYTVNRNAEQWIGLLPPTMNIVIHNHCPYDYCKSSALSLNLSNSDEQCSFNRSGILCGRCQPGLSHVLGTSNCKRCSNWWLLLTLDFALAGVALVAGLMLLNITVSTGTINGLIFYANIVRVNSAVFFPGERANTFLSLFIAWLNLDLGIETCFYDGLDAYAKTWLQLAFPLYIWFLVAVVIISCRHSKRASNLCGNNPVQVMATLFLLSYAKLLRVTITVFQPTHLLEHQKVWHYDGNIAYLGKRHAPLLFTALLLFVVFFIPYTLILFAIQWLQPFSHYKIFGWINQFKPLFDAYTGPYKDNHRYWTGLLLLVRIALFTVFSTNTSGDPAINLLAITVTIVCLFSYLALFAGVYKVCLLNILEYSFLLNLIILSMGVLYATSVDNKPVYVVTQISVAISLCITLIIIAYHSFNVVLKVLKLDKRTCRIPWNRKIQADNEFDTSVDSHTSALNHEVTHSSIELKEPLLEY